MIDPEFSSTGSKKAEEERLVEAINQEKGIQNLCNEFRAPKEGMPMPSFCCCIAIGIRIVGITITIAILRCCVRRR
jgi:hypothetical protein